ncbi:hypothetical protein KCU66_g72, partial [Aureobasidium melanogenum]
MKKAKAARENVCILPSDLLSQNDASSTRYIGSCRPITRAAGEPIYLGRGGGDERLQVPIHTYRWKRSLQRRVIEIRQTGRPVPTQGEKCVGQDVRRARCGKGVFYTRVRLCAGKTRGTFHISVQDALVESQVHSHYMDYSDGEISGFSSSITYRLSNGSRSHMYCTLVSIMACKPHIGAMIGWRDGYDHHDSCKASSRSSRVCVKQSSSLGLFRILPSRYALICMWSFTLNSPRLSTHSSDNVQFSLYVFVYNNALYSNSIFIVTRLYVIDCVQLKSLRPLLMVDDTTTKSGWYTDMKSENTRSSFASSAKKFGTILRIVTEIALIQIQQQFLGRLYGFRQIFETLLDEMAASRMLTTEIFDLDRCSSRRRCRYLTVPELSAWP